MTFSIFLCTLQSSGRFFDTSINRSFTLSLLGVRRSFHNYMKNNRHFLFTEFLDPFFFSFIFIPCQNCIFWMEFWILSSQSAPSVCHWQWHLLKSSSFEPSYIWRNRYKRIWRPDITNRWTKLILWYFLQMLIKADWRDIQPMETVFWLVADEEMGPKLLG